MLLADYTFEDQLIDRIAVRQLCATQLTARQQRVLSRVYRYGDTYKDIGKLEGVSGTRIMQLHDKALRRLRHHARLPRLMPLPRVAVTRKVPPPGFDKAEFLDHMRGLIRLRSEQEARAFETEMLATKYLADLAQPAPPPPPPSTTLEDFLAQPLPPPPQRGEPMWEVTSEQESLATARTFWTGISFGLGLETYHRVVAEETVVVRGCEIFAGRRYLLPFTICAELVAARLERERRGQVQDEVASWRTAVRAVDEALRRNGIGGGGGSWRIRNY